MGGINTSFQYFFSDDEVQATGASRGLDAQHTADESEWALLVQLLPRQLHKIRA